jgi:hypothetical protein
MEKWFRKIEALGATHYSQTAGRYHPYRVKEVWTVEFLASDGKWYSADRSSLCGLKPIPPEKSHAH